jgi:crotonobetainyl-CoA:carnitine CoA-transferase CaiB-like acyl-CoA transferase
MTILELGNFYAAPYGATVLTDLGARVIKVEPTQGDPMRTM